MPQKPLDELSPRYRRRLEAAAKKLGADLNAAGISRQQLRGHKPREHITRRENKIALHETPISSADYAFLKKQRARSPRTEARIVGRRDDGSPLFVNETSDQRFAKTRAAYLRLDRAQRDEVRHRQQTMERRYTNASRNGRSGDYIDDDFYNFVDDLEDDITPIYFYH